MTLDPGAAAFIEGLGGFSLSLDTDEEKSAFLDGMSLGADVDAGMGGEKVPVDRVEDVTVAAPSGEVTVRVYRPEGEALPLLVFMHGGVFVVGGLEMHDAVLRRMANALPAVIVSVDYRRAPVHVYPAAFDDSWAALQWAAEHAGELGADGDRLAVMGDSAGGALAALLAVRARDEGGPRIHHQVLLYPMVDPALDTASAKEFADGYLTTTSLLRLGWDVYLDGAEGGYTSPAAIEDLTGLAPTIVVTAGHDPLRDEGLAYIERLRQAGVPVEAMHYDGQIHGFTFMPAVIAEGDDALDALVKAIQATLIA